MVTASLILWGLTKHRGPQGHHSECAQLHGVIKLCRNKLAKAVRAVIVSMGAWRKQHPFESSWISVFGCCLAKPCGCPGTESTGSSVEVLLPVNGAAGSLKTRGSLALSLGQRCSTLEKHSWGWLVFTGTSHVVKHVFSEFCKHWQGSCHPGHTNPCVRQASPLLWKDHEHPCKELHLEKRAEVLLY